MPGNLLRTPREKRRWMDAAIAYLGQPPWRFVLPFWWAGQLKTSAYRGIPIHYEAYIGASYEPRLEGIGKMNQRVFERVDAAINTMEFTGEVASCAIIVPVSWCRVLGSHYRGCVVAPTVGAGDWDRGGPPRVEAPLAFGNTWVPINTEGVMTDEETPKLDEPAKRLKELPKEMTDAFANLINQELATTNPGRFARVAAVAELAQQLAALYFTRVQDIAEDQLVEAEMNAHPPTGRVGAALFHNQPAYGRQDALRQAGQLLQAARPMGVIRRDVGGRLVNEAPMMMADQYQAPQRPEDVVRDFVSTAMPMMREMHLNNLLQMRAVAGQVGFNTARIDERLREAEDAMVHSDLLRGHQGRDGGQQELQGPGAGRDAGGAEGAGRAREEGEERQVARQGGDDRHEHGAERAGGEGGGHPRPRAEAGEADRVGGEVQQRQDRRSNGADVQGVTTFDGAYSALGTNPRV